MPDSAGRACGGGPAGRRAEVTAYRNRYSRVERLLHRLAFATTGAQLALADLEDRAFAGRYASVAIERPVFVAGLPRSGTTLLLELIAALPGFAAHTYRDMPFPLTPLLWDALSRRFRVGGAGFERAHGDGMTVGYDSPEAFEELLWRVHWPERYLADRILPWTDGEPDPDGEFEPFFRRHVRKLIALRAAAAGRPAAGMRYASKNNANLARLARLRRMFPGAAILVPFREPLEHAASLLRQHRRFLAIHASDGFALRYMSHAGHFEFGAALRPIDFGGWLDASGGGRSPLGLDFWLAYWCAAYGSPVFGGATLVDYDALAADPEPALTRLGAAIGLDRPEALAEAAGRLRPPPARADADEADPALAGRARAIHVRLRALAV